MMILVNSFKLALASIGIRKITESIQITRIMQWYIIKTLVDVIVTSRAFITFMKFILTF